MKIVITGGTGFLGRQLSAYLSAQGHDLVLIQRSDWRDGIDRISKLINSSDVLINLAGSPVIKRWTSANKREILASRLDTTRLLVGLITKLAENQRPKVFLSASAIGVYDSNHIHNEQSVDFETNFLSEVCKQWEECLKPLNNLDIRVCVARIGIVLGKEGGMLKKLIPLFKLALGGKIGSGKQGFSFIHSHDLCRATEFLMEKVQCSGVFNLTAPEFTTNALFTKALATACGRPAIFPVPEFALRLLYGEAAVAMIKGQSVVPQHLLDCGFSFQYPDIGSCLQAILKEGK